MRSIRLKIALIFLPVALLILTACERHDYELLDPESAGKITLYTTADGLPSNQISSIKLDKRGNLWVSFPGYGIGKYDNNTWTFYRASTSQLLNDQVNCLAETAEGSLVIGTVNGISMLATTNVWSSYVDPADGMDVTSIKVGSNGWIWIGTRSQGFYVNTGSGYTKNLISGYEKVRAIEEGASGAIFIATDNGILKWQNNTFTAIKKTDGLPDENVTSLRFDSKERLWIGTETGDKIAWFDRKGIHYLNLLAVSDSIRIRDIFEDRRGNIWFATHKRGLIRYDGVIPRFITENNGFPENKINCIGEDKYGNLWFGLYSKGLVKYTLPVDW